MSIRRGGASRRFSRSPGRRRRPARKRVTFRRKGWTDRKINRYYKEGKIRIRAKTTKGSRYLRFYYRKIPRKGRGRLVKTVMVPYK